MGDNCVEQRDGDVIALPELVLAGRADFIAGYGFYAPTGRYEAGADDNIGLGMWSHEIQGGTTLYVNRGFGTVGPPARVGAPPEITRVVLVAA